MNVKYGEMVIQKEHADNRRSFSFLPFEFLLFLYLHFHFGIVAAISYSFVCQMRMHLKLNEVLLGEKFQSIPIDCSSYSSKCEMNAVDIYC